MHIRKRLFIFLVFLVLSTLAPVYCADLKADERLSELAVIERAEDERVVDERLISYLSRPDQLLAERAVLALGRIGDLSCADELTGILAAPGNPRLSEAAAFALGELESVQSIEVLLKVLNENSDIGVRGRAAEALGKIISSSAASKNLTEDKIKPVIEALIKKLPSPALALSTEQSLYSGLLISAILRSKSVDAIPGLLEQLKSVNADMRWQSANALVRMKVDISKFAASFLPLLKDENPLVRANAARALAAAKDKFASADLIGLLQDPDERVRSCAITALGSTGDTVAVLELIKYGHVLLRQLADYDRAKLGIPEQQNQVLLLTAALGNLKDERSLPLLKEIRDNMMPAGLQPEVEIALAAFGESKYLELVPPSAEKGFQSISAYAQGLAALKSEKCCSRLQDLLSANPDARAIPEILNALAACKAPDLRNILLANLKASDPVVKATAATLLAEQGILDDQVKESLRDAFIKAQKDKMNDARIALLDASEKLQYPLYRLALQGQYRDPDYIVRRRACEIAASFLKKEDMAGLSPGPAGSGHDDKYWRKMAQISLAGENPKALIRMKKGELLIEFYPKLAPMTVHNFLSLAGKGYFNGLSFMRVVPNFVVQGGDPRNDMNGGPGYQIRCEINRQPYLTGTLGMALSGKDTGGSQFFITHSPQPHLDGGYTVFAQLISGQDILPRIARGDIIEQIDVLDQNQ